MAQKTETKRKLTTARKLHDTSKVKIRSNRPTQIYKEEIVDDETGIKGQWLWGVTETGQYIGRVTIDRVNELTQERFEEGFEYTLPYSEENLKKILVGSFDGTKFYQKTGETTITVPKGQF